MTYRCCAIALCALIATASAQSADEDEAWPPAKCREAIFGDDERRAARGIYELLQAKASVDAELQQRVRELLGDPQRDQGLRKLCGGLLCRVGGEANVAAVIAVVRQTQDESLRLVLARHLAEATLTPAQARALIADLATPNARLREQLAGVLGAQGSVLPREAQAALAQLLRKDRDLRVRQAAVAALGKLGTEEAKAELERQLSETHHPYVMGALLGALGEQRELEPETLRRLAALVTDPAQRRFQVEATRALAKQKAAAAPVVKDLVAVLSEMSKPYWGAQSRRPEDPTLRAHLIQLFGEIGTAAGEAAAPALAASVRNGEPTGRSYPPPPRWSNALYHPAWKVFPKLGPQAVVHVVPFLTRRDLLLQHTACECLLAFEPSALQAASKELLAALPAALAHPDRTLRRRAAEVAARLGNQAAPLRPLLEQRLLAERYAEVRLALQLAEAAALGRETRDLAARLKEQTQGHEYESWRLSPDGRGPRRPHYPLRPGKTAKLFALDTTRPSAINAALFEDYDGLAKRLQALDWLPERSPSLHQTLIFSHLRPTVPVHNLEDVAYLHHWVRRRIVDVPLSVLESHFGERLYLGDLVQTDGYRGTETFIVAERKNAAGRWELRLVDPYRVEYYATPPSYLTYPDVVPTLSFWDQYQVECTPLSHTWVREHLAGRTLTIEGQDYQLEPKQLELLKEGKQRLYAHPGAGYVYFMDPAKVDRGAPIGAKLSPKKER